MHVSQIFISYLHNQTYMNYEDVHIIISPTRIWITRLPPKHIHYIPLQSNLLTEIMKKQQSLLSWVIKVPILQLVLLFRMQLWPVAHFFHSLLGGFAVALLLHPPKSEWKKWATGQSCIQKRSNTGKIGTLVNFDEGIILLLWSKSAYCW